jgi:hypothetical protein
MANYGYGDLSGMFGDRYSTQATLNDAMLRQAHSMGQLSSYGMGQASTYFQAAGGGTPLGSMLTQQHPMMKRQNLLDELQEKHPDPDTPEKLMALAADLSTNGFGDMAMKVRQAAMQMQQTVTAKNLAAIQLVTPTSDLLNQINFKLSASVITDEFLDSYLMSKQPLGENGLPIPFNIGNKADGGTITQSAYDSKKKAAENELKAQFKAFRNAISRDKKWTINEINSMLSNTDLLWNEFKNWAKTQGNERAEWLDKNMVIANPTGGATESTGEDINSVFETRSASDGGMVLSTLSPEKWDYHIAQAEAILANKPSEGEHKKMLEELQGIIDDPDSFFEGKAAIDNLDATQQIMYWMLKEEFPDTAAMNSGAFSDPATQMWFEEVLGDVRGQVLPSPMIDATGLEIV